MTGADGESAQSGGNMLLDRPADHIDNESDVDSTVVMPRLGAIGWARWAWRQLTSMRTALFLLLLLAVAAVPGSLFPQRSSDPNGVIQHFKDDPAGARFLDSMQLFTVYTSVWFSAIYLLLFISLIGCVIPRTRHHVNALRQRPPATPKNLSRLPAYELHNIDVAHTADERDRLMQEAVVLLRRARYRVVTYPEHDESAGARFSVSAERGYLRETGNLVFHFALVGILATVAIGGGFGFTGQRVVVEGQTFVNTRAAYDSFNPGRFFADDQLDPYSLALQSFSVDYVDDTPGSLGMVTDYTAMVTTQAQGSDSAIDSTVKVNEPLSIGGTEVYLLGNGYAPEITVRNPAGTGVFSDTVPFLPQDSNLTSLGVIKVPDGLDSQLGMIGFFYPTRTVGASGASFSVYPDLQNPVLTLNVYTGDLGIDAGDPTSVYALDTSQMMQLAGGTSEVRALELRPGESVPLPDGMGTVELTGVKRFASFDVAHDPTKGLVLVFALTMLAGLGAALFVPRRRLWVRVTGGGDETTIEYAALARGDDPGLSSALTAFAEAHLFAISTPRKAACQ